MLRTLAILLIVAAAPVHADINNAAASKYLDANCTAFLTFLRDPALMQGDAVIFYAGLKRGIEFRSSGQPPFAERYARSCTNSPTADVKTVLTFALQTGE